MVLDERENLGLAQADRRHHLDAVSLHHQAKAPGAGAAPQPIPDRGRADQQRGQASSDRFLIRRSPNR